MSVYKNSWTTFNGRKVSLHTIDHQHLSNVYYFNTLIGNMKKEDDFAKDIQHILDENFNGQLLSYRPHRKFTYEIEALTELGYLQSNGDIVVNNFKVGEIVTTETIGI